MYFEPAVDSLEGVQAFMAGHLIMDPEAIVSLNIVDIRKIFQVRGRKKKNGKKEEKVMITFGSMGDRDLVLGHCKNLPQDHSVEIVIPDYLQSLKRYLEKFAYRVRNRARTVHKTKFSTSIRMDDVEMSLYLATRERGQDKWRHYTKVELEELDDDLEKLDASEEESESEEDEMEETIRKRNSTPRPHRTERRQR